MYNSSPVEEMWILMAKDKQELTPERQQQVANMETFTNFCLIVAN